MKANWVLTEEERFHRFRKHKKQQGSPSTAQQPPQPPLFANVGLVQHQNQDQVWNELVV